MQAIFIPTPAGPAECILPGEMECVLEGVKWGSAEETLTPAYWAMRYRLHDAYGDYLQLGRSWRKNWRHLMGGYGMPAKSARRRSAASGMRAVGCHPQKSSRDDCRNPCW
jgi:hypothetical protein